MSILDFRSVRFLSFFLLLTLCTAWQFVTAATPLEPSFAAQVDALKSLDAQQGQRLKEMIALAENIAAGPIVARAYSLDDMAKGVVNGRRYLDSSSKAGALERRRPELAETFALASYDVGACRYILNEAPLLAAVYRLTGSPTVYKHLIAQLEEVATWDPFQRPGWTSQAMTGDTLPPGGDGVWLATGTIIQGLAITLDILPPDALPSALKGKLEAALKREIKRTATDWKDKRPWYVKQQKANSNQWIVPASGLVIGCSYFGPDKFPEEYAIGVKALRQSLEETGKDGSMSEGYTYGLDWSSSALLLANRFVRMAGDDPFAGYPFLKKFPLWASLLYQPGGNIVNSFDGFGAQRQSGVWGMRRQISRVAAIAQDPGLLWVLNHLGGGPSVDFFGLLTLGQSLQAAQPPPTSGLFEQSHMFVWRNSWEEDATGLWVRGGSDADFHDHWDRGHVNLILHGKLVLIEAGTPAYSDKAKRPEYDSLLGHNVLQVGSDTLPAKKAAPITVESNSPEGGKLSIEAGGTYPDLAGWKREVTWTQDKAVIVDTVKAKSEARKMVLRWHLATAKDAVIQGDGKRILVTIPAGEIGFPGWIGKWESETPKPTAPDIFKSAPMQLEIISDVPVKVTQTKRPDHTIKFRRTANPHTTLEISPETDTTAWKLQTAVSLGK